MIKINLSLEEKLLIEERHFKDMEEHGLDEFIILMQSNISKLREYMEMFNLNARNLVLANKEELTKIIEFVGEFDNRVNDEMRNTYNKFRNRKWAIELQKYLNVRTCPYCNRQYTFTLHKNDKVSPHYDHYFPISKYPYLQVSLYNLIPSCSTCNQKKSDKDPYQRNNCENIDFFYPYEEEFGNDVNFVIDKFEDTGAIIGLNENFNINIVANNSEKDQKLKTVNDVFKLEKLYCQHKDYVCDIIKKTIMYNDNKIHELYTNYNFLFESEAQMRDTIFMGYLNKEDWGKRPLSKFTHDIYNDLQKYTSEKNEIHQLRKRIDKLKRN